MKRAAIGIRAHSGWGAMVAVSGSLSNVHVLDRRRIVVIEAGMPGAKQPYHFAQGQSLPDAEKYLARCAAVSGRLAIAALDEIVQELRNRDYVVAGSAVLLASGRTLPALPQILASHPLIHTAEREFFRQAFWKASEELKIPVMGIRERDLNTRAEAIFGAETARLQREIAILGGSVGPPWTADQKIASLAALLVAKNCEMDRPRV